MRWEALFEDLEAQAEEDERAVRASEIVERTRAERAAITLLDRLLAHHGRRLTWQLVDGDVLTGRLADVGADWVVVEAGREGEAGQECLVPLHALAGVSGLSRMAEPGTQPARRLGLGVVLRGLSRDRAAVVVRTRGGLLVRGTVDRVGADHVDLALHPADEVRRAGSVAGVRSIPFAAVVSVRPGGG
jgi:hypothetical protein